jgi:hypothetical protein
VEAVDQALASSAARDALVRDADVSVRCTMLIPTDGPRVAALANRASRAVLAPDRDLYLTHRLILLGSSALLTGS